MTSVNSLATTALVFIFLVIIAGSVVRMTGSGMGCPDWPKCFGYYIPPTHEEQVLWGPGKSFDEGQMIVIDDALWKAKRSFTTSDSFDVNNWEKYEQHDYAIFNATHTWIEYINRLLGALSGVPVLLLVIASLFQIRKDFWIVLMSVLTLAALGYEAWLGKLVVDGNLVPNAITKHMFGSLLIVTLLVAIISRSSKRLKFEVSKGYKYLLVITLVLLAVQILLGTQVREQIDEIAKAGVPRSGWISLLDDYVLIHRSSSILILLLLLFGFWRSWRNDYGIRSVGIALVLAILVAAGGAIMFYLDVPRFIQPIHLVFSAIMFAYLVHANLRTTAIKR